MVPQETRKNLKKPNFILKRNKWNTVSREKDITKIKVKIKYRLIDLKKSMKWIASSLKRWINKHLARFAKKKRCLKSEMKVQILQLIAQKYKRS